MCARDRRAHARWDLNERAAKRLVRPRSRFDTEGVGFHIVSLFIYLLF